MKHRNLLLFTFLFVICLATGISTKVDAAGAVKLNQSKLVLGLDEVEQLQVLNTTGNVKWSSSNEDVVEVDQNGGVTSTGVGMAKVTAKVNGKKYICKVSVADYSEMSDEQKAVVGYALQYVGNKYVYGGSSLTKGTDCSGFTMSVYKKFGYNLPHNSQSQMTSKSVKKVSMKKLKPGDLIFYGSSKRNCSHVALYIGNEKVVHASNEITGITISDYKYRKTLGAGRVLKTETYSVPEDGQNDATTRYAISK
ncbi:MAG: NlpC/P60 family protein [Clostridiales bacterium]|nr:NlpC/P60 family protein [Clostridiales bacterium]